MNLTTYQIKLKAVIDEIQIARKIIAGADILEEVKRNGEFMPVLKLGNRREATKRKVDDTKTIEVRMITGSGKGTDKKGSKRRRSVLRPTDLRERVGRE